MKRGAEVEDWDSTNVLEIRPSAEHRSSLWIHSLLPLLSPFVHVSQTSFLSFIFLCFPVCFQIPFFLNFSHSFCFFSIPYIWIGFPFQNSSHPSHLLPTRFYSLSLSKIKPPNKRTNKNPTKKKIKRTNEISKMPKTNQNEAKSPHLHTHTQWN